ncbi:hypothetical protein [Paenibacillus sp. FSL R7-269]|uniref:hypothetical protein n=1 Tax=Paenibacillus sp. FSL R7-269 TaxID=1226755 RepID=UPI0004BB9EE2|nr:hypothetical protein [Paenibacillus sp. FSL R7-269]
MDKEIKAIEHSAEYRGNQQKLEELTRKVENQWSAVQKEMLEVMNAYTQYQKYLEQEAEEGRSKSRQAQQELVNAHIEVRRTRDWLDRFEARTNTIVDQYGHGVRFDPVPFVEHEQIEQEKTKQKLIQWENKAKSLDQQHRSLENGETRLKSELNRVTQDTHQRYTQYEEQIQAEHNLAAQVCRLLRVDREEHVPLPEFLLSRRSVLEERQDYWNKRITELRKQQWDIEQVLSVDAELGGSDTWIPNKTMAETKSKLESKGFRIVSGTEYLQDKNESQQESLLQSFPLLPYSLIVMQNDIGSICSSNLFADDIHTSPVPLYAAELLGEQEHNLFHIASNRAYQLAKDPEAWKRKKEQLESERQLLIEQIGKSVDFEEEHREVAQSIKNLLYTTTSVRLLAEFEQLDLTQKEMDHQLQNIQNEIIVCQKELKECLETVDATRQVQDQQAQMLQELIDYAELFLEQDQWRHDHYSEEQKVKELEVKDRQGDEQLKRSSLLSREWETAYWEWDTKMNRILEKVQLFIPSALLPRPTASAISSVEPVLQCNTSLLEEDIAVLKSLRDEIDQNHMQLGILRSKRVETIDKGQAAQKNLVDFDSSWEDQPSPTSSQSVLERKVTDCEMELTKAHALEREQDMAKTRAEKDVEHARNLRIRQESRVKSPNPWEEEQDLDKKEREIHFNLESQKRQSDDIVAQLNATDGLIRELEKVSGSLRMVDTEGNCLPYETGLIESLRNRAQQVVEEWINQRKAKVAKADEAQRRAQSTLNRYKGKTEQSTWDEVLKQAVLSEFRSCEATRDKVEESLEVVAALRDYVQFELEKQQEEKNLSEKARSDWSKHAARFCIQVIGNIKTMTQQMTIKSNRGGYKFELVRLKRAERLPQAIEDIETPVQEFFDKTLIDLLAVHESMERVELKAVIKRVNASDMVYAALNYSYPILEMYNLNTDNTFLTEPMRPNDFDTWETINNGSFTKTAGSGGQLVAARTLIAMMLMTFKRQSSDKHRSVLISDNPFANAISPHVIDPIFAIADVLQFQWVVFTPTELVKLEISQKFPVYCALELEKQVSGKDVVIHHVYHGFRQIEQAPRLI